MRLSLGVLAIFGLSAVTAALADPPATTDATSPAAASTASSTPTKTTAQADKAATASKPADTSTSDLDDRHFRAEGYRVRMVNGRKLYCRKEDVIGSRLGSSNETCGDAETLKSQETQARAEVERNQRQQSGGLHGN